MLCVLPPVCSMAQWRLVVHPYERSGDSETERLGESRGSDGTADTPPTPASQPETQT